MNIDTKDTKGKIRMAYILAFLSTLLTIGTSLIDAYISRNIIVSSDESVDKILAACVHLTLGGTFLIGFFVVLAFTPFARWSDPTFKKLSIGTAQFQRLAITSGVLAATGTGLFLFALQRGHDPAILVAFGSSTVLWTIAFEYLVDRRHPSPITIIGPALLMMAGVWVSQTVTAFVLEAFLLIFVGMGILRGVGRVATKYATGLTDSVTMTVWRGLYLTLTGTLISVLVAWKMGKMELYLHLLEVGLPRTALLFLTSMFFVFFSSCWSARAMTYLTMGASKITIITELEIVGTFLALLILQYVLGTSAFGQLPEDTASLLRRGFGAILITSSVVWLIRKK